MLTVMSVIMLYCEMHFTSP